MRISSSHQGVLLVVLGVFAFELWRGGDWQRLLPWLAGIVLLVGYLSIRGQGRRRGGDDGGATGGDGSGGFFGGGSSGGGASGGWGGDGGGGDAGGGAGGGD